MITPDGLKNLFDTIMEEYKRVYAINLDHELNKPVLEGRIKQLESRLIPLCTMLTDFTIILSGCSREQELAWKQAVKNVRELLPREEEERIRREMWQPDPFAPKEEGGAE